VNKKTIFYYLGNFFMGLLGIGIALAFFLPSMLPFRPFMGGIILLVSLYVMIYTLILMARTKKGINNEAS